MEREQLIATLELHGLRPYRHYYTENFYITKDMDTAGPYVPTQPPGCVMIYSPEGYWRLNDFTINLAFYTPAKWDEVPNMPSIHLVEMLWKELNSSPT